MFDRILKFWRDPTRRPLWQIPLMLIVFLIYIPASAYVRWADRL